MKKDDENKTKDLFNSFLPDHVKDDPNENLKKEKKIFSIIFIVICTLLLAANLLAMIINFSTLYIRDGLLSLFVGFINCAISIFLLGLLIIIAHNISKMTRATLFMCNKLMKDEKRYLEEEKKKNEDAKEEVECEKDIKVEEKAVKEDIVETKSEKSSVSVDDEVTTIEAEVIIDED